MQKFGNKTRSRIIQTCDKYADTVVAKIKSGTREISTDYYFIQIIIL